MAAHDEQKQKLADRGPELKGLKVLVIGAGASGLSAARLCLRREAEVHLYDRRDDVSARSRLGPLADAGVRLWLGGKEPEFDALEGVNLAVVSPGVPPAAWIDRLALAGAEVIAEVELAARNIEAIFIAITGTNGKSTVTTLVGEMMAKSGFATFVGGNLGAPLCDAVDTPAGGSGGVVVAELSSFQLERVSSLRPKVAALLNISPDHLDRYPDFAGYASAKGHIFRAQQASDHAVVFSSCPESQAQLAKYPSPQNHLFGEGGEVHIEGEELVDEGKAARYSLDTFPLMGAHNRDNACAATLIARLAGASAESIASALGKAKALSHRSERVAEHAGVLFIDDSKATNVGATLASLVGLSASGRKIVLIAGGVHKGSSYQPLQAPLREVGRAIVLIGEAAPLLRQELQALGLPAVDASDMTEAVDRAAQLAHEGDIVLLAPACSSFDMFSSYRARGMAFQDAVKGRCKETKLADDASRRGI